MTTTSLPTDTYYRGYRLTLLNEGTPKQYVQVRHMGDPEVICLVPDTDHAKRSIDEWHNAK